MLPARLAWPALLFRLLVSTPKSVTVRWPCSGGQALGAGDNQENEMQDEVAKSEAVEVNATRRRVLLGGAATVAAGLVTGARAQS